MRNEKGKKFLAFKSKEKSNYFVTNTSVQHINHIKTDAEELRCRIGAATIHQFIRVCHLLNWRMLSEVNLYILYMYFSLKSCIFKCRDSGIRYTFEIRK